MAIVINGQTGIDAGHLPISNAGNTEVEGTLTAQGQNVSPFSGFKNYIINGNFDIWQRGTSFSSISYEIFTADRWLLWAAAASGISASKQPGLVGKNSLYIGRTGGTTMQVYQMVENQGNLSNKIFTFSALVRSSYNGTVNFSIADGRSATNFAYIQTPVTLEANIPKKIIFTLQLGQVSADALVVGIVTTCTDLYIDAVQMEEGSVATPFENRPIGLELSLCQRYYQKISDSVSFSADSNGFSTYQSLNAHPLGRKYLLPVPMRISPTVQYVSLTTGYTGGTPTVTADSTILTISLNSSITGCTLPYIYVSGLTLSAEL